MLGEVRRRGVEAWWREGGGLMGREGKREDKIRSQEV